MIISHDDRALFRGTISKINDLVKRVEAVGRGQRPMTADLAKLLYQTTGSNDLHTQFEALSAMRDEVAKDYDERLCDASRSDLSAFAEFMVPEEPPAGHHIYLCNHLHHVEAGDIPRSMISMPPGHAKPISVDTPVMMGDGSWKRLGDCEVGDFVVTGQGRAREVLAVHEQGEMTAIRITTRSGREVVSEPSHPFLTPAGWVEAGDLLAGDRLTLVKEYELGDHSGRSYAEFALAGYMVALGFVRCRAYGRVWTLGDQFRADDPAIIDDFLQLARSLGFNPQVGRWHAYKESMHTVNFCDGMKAWAKAAGLYGMKRAELHAPEWVFLGDRSRIAHFLGAIASMDANFAPERAKARTHHRGMRSLTFVTRSKPLMRDLQRLLLRLGARSRKTRSFHRNYNDGPMTFWYLSVEQGGDQAELKRTLRLTGATRRFWNLPIVVDEWEHPTYATDEIVSIEECGTAQMRCLTVEEDSSFLADGLVVHNSRYGSHFYPAWYLGRHPHRRYLQAGHSQKFCEEEFSKTVRSFVDSERYRMVFPDVVLSDDTKNAAKWKLAKHNGQYVTRGVGQKIAGIRGDAGGGDDLIGSLEEAESQVIRDKTYGWYWTDFETRFLPGAPVFLIATRWHIDDPLGRIEAASKKGDIPPWVIINLPAYCTDPENDPLGRQLGEPLWPNFFTEKELNRLKAGMEPRRWEALYQGNPVPSEGRMIKDDWLHRYEDLPHRNADPSVPLIRQCRRVTISVDCANKDTQRSDFSVITVWYESACRKHFLAEVVRKRLQFPDLVATIEETAQRHGATAILVEDAGAGTQYIQLRSGKAPAPIVPIKTRNQDKEFRFDAVLPMFEAGEVWVPKVGGWMGEYLAELLIFPDGKHDDQVDSTSQYLHWARFKRARGTRKAIGA